MALRNKTTWLLRFAVVFTILLALAPFGRLVADWVEYARVVQVPLEPLPPRGFDWVRWEDRDGEIVAIYVHAGGTAHAEGRRGGGALFQLEFQQFFSADDVKRVVERSPGMTLTYEVLQGGELRTLDIPVTRYPTFLYPLSATLWVSSAWAFGLATFIHLLAALIVVPLALRSRRALRSSLLIAAALLWVGGNLARIVMIMVAGPSALAAGGLSESFEVLTLVSLTGWTLFPALLLWHVLLDARPVRDATRPVLPLVFLPPVVLGGVAAVATVKGSLGPLPPDALLAPILFYVCCYLAASTVLIVGGPWLQEAHEEGHPAPGWSRIGSLAVLALAVAGGLFVVGALPVVAGESDARAGAFIVLLQLLSLAPVVLVSLATLRYGRFDAVLTRALAYTSVLGLVFFAFVGGLWLIGLFGPEGLDANPVVAGLLVVLLLVVAERLARPLRRVFADLVATDRQRARQQLNRLGDRVRYLLDAERLAHEAVTTVGTALGARSAVLFLCAEMGTPRERWVQATFRPERPYFTRAELARVWTRLQEEGQVWARNPELNESSIPQADAVRLRQFGVALAVPVTSGRGEPAGVLVLGRKARRRAVYNLEDVEMLKALCGQLALATERLGLIEREKALVRESAEAQLAALRAQINPHFLFNALNTIAALIAEKPAEAEATVQQLAGLFRYVLQAGSRLFVPLGEELRLVRQYLAVEQARFGDALIVSEAWDDGVESVQIPAFALQTLVENGVKHGIERKRGGGTVRLEGRRRSDGTVEVTVTDSGVGIPALFAAGDGATPEAPPDFYGIGLRNVADRLEQLYGRDDLLTMESAPGDGTVVRLLLPAPSAPSDAGADGDAASRAGGF
ncbi:MAG: histidine kinase [Rubricoccaceae bacterium]|nr:histidine kinase [Rubricoccaceae bacterium]